MQDSQLRMPPTMVVEARPPSSASPAGDGPPLSASPLRGSADGGPTPGDLLHADAFPRMGRQTANPRIMDALFAAVRPAHAQAVGGSVSAGIPIAHGAHGLGTVRRLRFGTTRLWVQDTEPCRPARSMGFAGTPESVRSIRIGIAFAILTRQVIAGLPRRGHRYRTPARVDAVTPPRAVHAHAGLAGRVVAGRASQAVRASDRHGRIRARARRVAEPNAAPANTTVSVWKAQRLSQLGARRAHVGQRRDGFTLDDG